MNPFNPISISLSPNTEKDDIRLALKLIFQPWKWKNGKAIKELEDKFKDYFKVKYAFSFNSGRSCLTGILKALEFEKGTEILLQAFTCNAAVNPVLWSGLKPIYVDCDQNTFNIDIQDLKRKITPKTKAIMVQHTFGRLANMAEILEIVKENNLILIEDCAHSLGLEYNGIKAGTFGRVGFFSFSRDKIISSVYGGMIITNDDNLAKKIDEFEQPGCCWVLQQLLHPVLMNYFILPTYNLLKIGKICLILSQWLHILSKAVHWKEKRGRMPGYFPKKMPNALACLALHQFNKLDRFNIHRKEIAEIYFRELKDSLFELPEKDNNVFLRFTIKHSQAHEIIKRAWQNNFLIGDWYTSPVAPDDTQLDKLDYVSGSCPNAEELSKITLNLPTHINISDKQVNKLISFLKTI